MGRWFRSRASHLARPRTICARAQARPQRPGRPARGERDSGDIAGALASSRPSLYEGAGLALSDRCCVPWLASFAPASVRASAPALAAGPAVCRWRRRPGGGAVRPCPKAWAPWSFFSHALAFLFSWLLRFLRACAAVARCEAARTSARLQHALCHGLGVALRGCACFGPCLRKALPAWLGCPVGPGWRSYSASTPLPSAPRGGEPIQRKTDSKGHSNNKKADPSGGGGGSK